MSKHAGGRPKSTDKDLTVSITTRLAADEAAALDKKIKGGSRSPAVRLAVLAWLGLSAGCAVGDTTPLPGQEQAVAIIWNQIYGQTNAAPPIYWRRDRCNEPNGIYAPLPTCSFDDLHGDSVSGLQRDTPWHVEVGAPWGEGKISDTSLAHELLHAVIGDQGHHSEKWDGCGKQLLNGVWVEKAPSLLCMAHESLVAAGL